MYSYGSPHMAAQKQDDQLERTFSSYVRIQVVVLKTYLGRWTIGRSGERGSGISVLAARYDDDDIYIYILLGLYNTPTASLQRGKTPTNKCPGYDTKQSDCEALVMLELWLIGSTPSSPSLPALLWPGVVAPDIGPFYELNRTRLWFLEFTLFCI